MAGKTVLWFAAAVPCDARGGVSRVMGELSSRLTMKGLACEVLTAGQARVHANYVIFALWLAARYLFAFGKRPRWIIARSTDGFAAALFAKLLHLGLGTALHSHGWEEKAYEAELAAGADAGGPKTTWKARAVRFPMLRATLALCDTCLCGTVEEARWIKGKYPRFAPKIVCVPNGTDVRTGASRGWPAGVPPEFLCVANATWKKNLARTLRVFRETQKLHPVARLTVVGCSPEDLEGVTGVPVTPGVSAVSSEAPESMLRRYLECPYLISCSRYEGGRSLAILEAMSAGCVVFVSAIPSSLECVRNGVTGLVLPGKSSVDDAGIIARALADPALCARVSEKAVLFAERQSWERQARRLERALCLAP
jgi:glycosyltransferase involved in cell wall biosynthesis